MTKRATSREIFLSYAHQDRRLAGKAKKQLEAHGWTGFLAHEDIEPTAEWRARIRERLDSCSGLIVLVTRKTRTSAWVNQEVGIALGKEKPVISLIFGKSQILRGFHESLQGIPASESKMEEAVKRALKVFAARKEPSTFAATRFRLEKLQIYASLHQICANILHRAPRPGQMLGKITHSLTRLSDEERSQLWNKGTSLPSVRISEPEFKEIDGILIERRYLIEDSTVNAWDNVSRKYFYGAGPVQIDLEFRSFKSFVDNVDRVYVRLRKKLRLG